MRDTFSVLDTLRLNGNKLTLTGNVSELAEAVKAATK